MKNKLPEDLPLDDAVEAVIRRLRKAFARCEAPQGNADMASVGGIDSFVYLERWRLLTREDVEELPESFLVHGGEINCMSSMARRYFVPSLMIWLLKYPERERFDELQAVLWEFESMWVRSPEHRYSRATRLNRDQATAVREWCEVMLRRGVLWCDGIIESNEELSRLLCVAGESVGRAVDLEDFDRKYLEEVARDRVPKGERPARRTGWKKYREKGGRGMREDL